MTSDDIALVRATTTPNGVRRGFLGVEAEPLLGHSDTPGLIVPGQNEHTHASLDELSGLVYATRLPVIPGTEEDPISLATQVRETGARTRQFATHHDRFNVSETTIVRDIYGELVIISGANYNPFGGEHPTRTCAFGSMMIKAAKEGDIFGGFIYVLGPESSRMKDIVKSRRMKSVPSCGPCRPVLLDLDPMTAVFAENADSSGLVDAYYVLDAERYHIGESNRYPRRPQSYRTNEAFMMDVIVSGFNYPIVGNPAELVETTIEPWERT